MDSELLKRSLEILGGMGKYSDAVVERLDGGSYEQQPSGIQKNIEEFVNQNYSPEEVISNLFSDSSRSEALNNLTNAQLRDPKILAALNYMVRADAGEGPDSLSRRDANNLTNQLSQFVDSADPDTLKFLAENKAFRDLYGGVVSTYGEQFDDEWEGRYKRRLADRLQLHSLNSGSTGGTSPSGDSVDTADNQPVITSSPPPPAGQSNATTTPPPSTGQLDTTATTPQGEVWHMGDTGAAPPPGGRTRRVVVPPTTPPPLAGGTTGTNTPPALPTPPPPQGGTTPPERNISNLTPGTGATAVTSKDTMGDVARAMALLPGSRTGLGQNPQTGLRWNLTPPVPPVQPVPPGTAAPPGGGLTHTASLLNPANLMRALVDLEDWSRSQDSTQVLAKVAMVQASRDGSVTSVEASVRKADFLGRLLASNYGLRELGILDD